MIVEDIFKKTKSHDSLREVGTTGTYTSRRLGWTSVSKGRGSSSATVGEGGEGRGGGGYGPHAVVSPRSWSGQGNSRSVVFWINYKPLLLQ